MSRHIPALIVPVALAALVAVPGCKSAPPSVHPLAAEHLDYCAQYLEQGELDKAQHRCELALEYNRDYPLPYNLLGLIWVKRGNCDKAKDQFIKALRLHNDFAEAHNNLGYCYLQKESYGRAHDSFLSALKINPGYVAARYNLCLSLLKLKKFDAARVCYDKVMEINPTYAQPYNDLCVMDIEDKNHADAIQNCSRAIQLDPKYVEAYFHLGRAFQEAGKHCEAEESYKRCVELDENNAECRNNLSSSVRHCALQSPKLREAKSDVVSYNSPEAVLKLGLAEKEQGLVPEAMRRFEKCVKLDGRFGPCYCQIAALKKREAREDEARKACTKCLNYSTGEQNSPERDACERMLKTEE